MPLNHLISAAFVRITTVQQRPPAVIGRGIKENLSAMIRRASAAEVIDDSEPEREELRRREKDQRKKLKALKPLGRKGWQAQAG